MSSTSTSLTISWALAEGVTADNYTIFHSNTNTDCFNITPDVDGSDGGIIDTIYTLIDLEEGTEYSITVTATLMGEEVGTDTMIATTHSTG